MKMRDNNYQDIRTLDELNAAIVRSRGRIEAQGKAVAESYGRVQSFYTPQTLVTEGVRKATRSLSFYGVALGLVSNLRKRLAR